MSDYSFFMILNIKNMTGLCCMRIAQDILLSSGYKILNIKPMLIELAENTCNEILLNESLAEFGMSIIVNPEILILEKIKQAIHELIFEMNNVSSIADKSEYLVEKLRMSYRQISQIFTKYEPQTLERYIIEQKMQRVKHLLVEGDFTLSEIAYMMDYSSVQYLSTQFKKEIGLSVTEYKEALR